MNPNQELPSLTRRGFLGHGSRGITAAALASLLPARASADGRGLHGALHHRPKIKRIVHLCMAGGPSHLETLDWKPKLREMHGQPMPDSYTKGQQIAQLQGQRLVCFGPQHDFQRFGERLASLDATAAVFASSSGIDDANKEGAALAAEKLL